MSKNFAFHQMRLVLTTDDFAAKHAAIPDPVEHSNRAAVECVYLSGSSQRAARAAALLCSAGVRLHHVGSIEEALSCTAFAGPLVLMMDVNSDHSNYKRDLERLVRHAPGVSIVAITDSAEPSWEELVLAGGYDVIREPFEAAELTHVVMGAHRCSEICADSEASLRRRDALMAAVRESLRQAPAVAPAPAEDLAGRIVRRLRGLLPQRLVRK